MSMGAEEWNCRYAGAQLLWTAQPNRFLVAETSDLQPGRALDLACGEGRNAVWLAERGWRATGVDFSGVAIAKAAELASIRGVEVEWLCADVLRFRAEPQSFDLVIAFYLQLPVDERQVAMRAAADAVAPGGVLLVVAHDSSNPEHGWGGPRTAAVLYTPSDVIADLDRSGLAVERADVVERPVDTPEGGRIALDALVRARRA